MVIAVQKKMEERVACMSGTAKVRKVYKQWCAVSETFILK